MGERKVKVEVTRGGGLEGVGDGSGVETSTNSSGGSRGSGLRRGIGVEVFIEIPGVGSWSLVGFEFDV